MSYSVQSSQASAVSAEVPAVAEAESAAVTQRKVIHIDCDCFFAAVEMRENPALRELPIAIGV